MTKISKRLQSILEYVSLSDSIIDVGCDHGLLSIFLKENNLCKKIIASDVNRNALNNAINNIKKRDLSIETYLSDGIDQVPLDGINTLIISGMGTSTILHILRDSNKLKNISKIIIQSNNDLELLRSEMNKKGYYLESDIELFDSPKWYVTNCFVKSTKKNTDKEVEFGYLNNPDYTKYLIEFYEEVLKKIPETSINDKQSKKEKIEKLKATL